MSTKNFDRILLLKITIKNTEIKISTRDIAVSLLVVVTSLVPLLSFKSQILAGGDVFVYYNPEAHLVDVCYTWFETQLGQTNLQPCNSIPYFLHLVLLKSIGLPIWLIQRVYIVMFFLVMSLSILWLARILNINSGFARFSIVVFYATNTYISLNGLPTVYKPIYLAYALTPLFLGLWIKGIESKDYKYAFYINVISILLAPTFNNPIYYLDIWICVFLYIIYRFLVLLRRYERDKIISAIKFVSLTIGTVVLINLFWIMPFLCTVISPITSKELEFASRLAHILKSRGVFNSIRLLGYGMIHQGALGSPYVPQFSVYETPLFILITSAIPIIAFAASLTRRRNINLNYFLLLGVISFFLMKGEHPPLGEVYTWLYRHFPGFWIFRDPYGMFQSIVVFAYTVLIGYFIDNFLKSGSLSFRGKNYTKIKFIKQILTAIIICILVLNGWPMFLGEAVAGTPRGGVGKLPGFEVNVPDYWVHVSDWINNQEGDWQVLLLPPNEFYQVDFSWKLPYRGVDPAPYMISKPIAFFTPGGGYYIISASKNFIAALTSQVKAGLSSQFLNFGGIKYIIVREDVATSGIGSEFYSTLLDKQPGITLVKSFGPLKIYQNKFWRASKIYATANYLTLVNDDLVARFSGVSHASVISSEPTPKSSSFTMTMWFNTFVPKGVIAGFSNINYSRENLPSLQYDCIAGFLEKTRQLAFGIRQPPKNYYVIAPERLDDGEWHFAASELNSKGMYLYIDGKLVATNLDINTSVPYDAYLWIGAETSVSGWEYSKYFEGYIANVQWYNVSLAPSEILALYRKGIFGSPLSTQNLVKWWSGKPGEKSFKEEGISWHPKLYESHKLLKSQNMEVQSVILFPSQVSLEQISLIKSIVNNSTKVTNITYEKINPTKYSVQVTADSPFLLIFKQSYSPNWNAYTPDRKVTDQLHFIANGFANGWIIEKTGTYTIIIEYGPQRFVYVGTLLSVLTIGICLLYLLRKMFKLHAIHRKISYSEKTGNTS